MKVTCIAIAATLAMASAVPAEAGNRGRGGYNHGGGPVIGAAAGAKVAAKISVLNIVKVKAGVGLGLGLGLGGR
jgi:hypothetical protein